MSKAPKAEIAWTTPQMKAALEEQLADVKSLAGSRVIRTEEARELVLRLQRLIEVLVYGEARTPLPTRHHE